MWLSSDTSSDVVCRRGCYFITETRLTFTPAVSLTCYVAFLNLVSYLKFFWAFYETSYLANIVSFYLTFFLGHTHAHRCTYAYIRHSYWHSIRRSHNILWRLGPLGLGAQACWAGGKAGTSIYSVRVFCCELANPPISIGHVLSEMANKLAMMLTCGSVGPWVRPCVRACLCVCACLWNLRLSLCVCACMWAPAGLCMCVCACLGACLSLSVCVCVCACVRLCARGSVCVCACAHVRACADGYEFVSVPAVCRNVEKGEEALVKSSRE